MIVETDNLITVRTYANKKGITTQQAYNHMNDDKVQWIEIDSVKFIILE